MDGLELALKCSSLLMRTMSKLQETSATAVAPPFGDDILSDSDNELSSPAADDDETVYEPSPPEVFGAIKKKQKNKIKTNKEKEKKVEENSKR
uniref:Uncharacterized protein n=1 Tax=Romanomermis culicivorax TaxID=13658 RepID=A0A915K5J5_ROMCU